MTPNTLRRRGSSKLTLASRVGGYYGSVSAIVTSDSWDAGPPRPDSPRGPKPKPGRRVMDNLERPRGCPSDRVWTGRATRRAAIDTLERRMLIIYCVFALFTHYLQ